MKTIYISIRGQWVSSTVTSINSAPSVCGVIIERGDTPPIASLMYASFCTANDGGQWTPPSGRVILM